MMKRWIVILTVLMLCAGLSITVSAASDEKFVYDHADLLASSEERELTQKLREVSREYRTQIVVATVSSTNGASATSFTSNFYDQMGIGYGSDRSGVLLLVSMAPREFRILTEGTASKAITLSDINKIKSAIQQDLSNGDYEDAFEAFADQCEDYLGSYANAGAFNFKKNLLICAVIGVVISLITVLVLKSQLKSVRMQNQAYNYVRPNSMHLTHSSDIFLYRNVRRVAKPQNNSGSGRSGSSRNIGGGSF